MTDSQGAQKFERSFSKVCPSVAGVLLDISQACVHTYNTHANKHRDRAAGCIGSLSGQISLGKVG